MTYHLNYKPYYVLHREHSGWPTYVRTFSPLSLYTLRRNHSISNYILYPLVEFSSTMRRIRGNNQLGPLKAIPLPQGWSFAEESHHLQVVIGKSAMPKYKLLPCKRDCAKINVFFEVSRLLLCYLLIFGDFGLVCSIEFPSKMEAATKPIRLQIVSNIAFKYGTAEAERRSSRISDRVNAFFFSCLHRKRLRLHHLRHACECFVRDCRFRLQFGASNRISDTLCFTKTLPFPNLIQFKHKVWLWAPTSFTDWYHAQPSSYWGDGLELCAEAIYYLPTSGWP